MQTVSISDSFCCLVSDHSRRITAVKLLTSSSPPVMTPHPEPELSLDVHTREAVSHRF